ncbi:MAG: Maf-like protein [Gammaproteobacteria bacterium]|nr:Maf-like protein [Gammaproteobacteria bacterium]MCW8988347.1 Maf-like protein [Gammaproteobacteria bacterium]
MKLILASTSPFRKAILDKLGIDFDIASPDVDETALKNETPQQLVERLSIAKAKAVADKNESALVIGSDQVSVINNEIIGKPHTHENAIKQLQNASGKTVTFYTGLCLYNSSTDEYQSEVVPFNVVFRQLNDQQIESYLKKETPYNCAGSFKSEALGIVLFEKLEGEDPNTLMGLPLIRLVKMLEKENYSIL